MSLIDWRGVRLVVFDVDGTLYDQRKLRLRMAAELARYCVSRGNFSTLRILGTYRAQREVFADSGVEGFEDQLISYVATRRHTPEAKVRETVRDWIESRPLPLLQACRYAGLPDLFERIRASGRTIGVLSDYPAVGKMTALGLGADHIIAAADPEIRIMKPNPRGLLHLMKLAGVDAASTIMIGDRAERDGEMARRAGVDCYLRTSRPIVGWSCFSSFAQIAAGLPAERARE